MNRIDVLKNVILAMGTVGRVRINGKAVLVDLATAKVCVEVHDSLNEDNRAAFNSLPWDECVALSWRLTLRPGSQVTVGGRLGHSTIKAFIAGWVRQFNVWFDALIDRYIATRSHEGRST